MDTTEITTILRTCLAELTLVNKSERLKALEHSRFYSTTNDVFLGDAVNTIGEVICAIEEADKYEGKANSIVSYIVAEIGKS